MPPAFNTQSFPHQALAQVLQKESASTALTVLGQALNLLSGRDEVIVSW